MDCNQTNIENMDGNNANRKNRSKQRRVNRAKEIRGLKDKMVTIQLTVPRGLVAEVYAFAAELIQEKSSEYLCVDKKNNFRAINEINKIVKMTNDVMAISALRQTQNQLINEYASVKTGIARSAESEHISSDSDAVEKIFEDPIDMMIHRDINQQSLNSLSVTSQLRKQKIQSTTKLTTMQENKNSYSNTKRNTVSEIPVLTKYSVIKADTATYYQPRKPWVSWRTRSDGEVSKRPTSPDYVKENSVPKDAEYFTPQSDSSAVEYRNSAFRHRAN